MPGSQAHPDNLRINAMGHVWLHDTANGALLCLDGEQATSRVLPNNRPTPGSVLLGGRPGETWNAEPAADRLYVIHD